MPTSALKGQKIFNVEDCSAYYKEFNMFENLPAAVLILRVDIDAQHKPVDCLVVYANSAASTMLHNIFARNIIGIPLYKMFPSIEHRHLYAYWQTAYHGTNQELEQHIPDTGLHLTISCYQPRTGLCGCILQDVTYQHILRQDAARKQHKLEILLQNSADYLFDFDPDTATMSGGSRILGQYSKLPFVRDLPDGLIQVGLLKPEYRQSMQDMIDSIRTGCILASCTVEFRPTQDNEFQWYRISLHTYQEPEDTPPAIIGYIKNVHQEMLHQKRLEILANLDSLTQIHNLRAGRQLVEDLLGLPQPAKGENTMFIFDIDDFKNVNDIYGHYTGDQALKGLARVLTTVFRQTDIVYRMGGDEFIVFAPNAGNDYFIRRVCRDIKTMCAEMPELDFPISISIGVAVTNSPQASYDDYYQTADQALYHIKKKDKGSYHCIYF